MIHQLLNLTRPLFVFDVESTGTDPRADRIVELGFQEWGAAGVVKEWRSLVNPGVPIPAGATRVHHITDDMMTKCQKCGRAGDLHPYSEVPEHMREILKSSPTTKVTHGIAPEIAAMNDGCPAFKFVPSFKQLASNLAFGFKDCDFAGQHVRFDLEILAAEMKRAGQTWSYAGARVVDSLRLEALLNPRSISHLYKKYKGEDLINVHSALVDVRATAEVLDMQLLTASGMTDFSTDIRLPLELDALHALQWPGWLTAAGEFREVDGITVCAFGKHKGKTLREIPVDYFDWMIRDGNFPEDVLRIARDAKKASGFPAWEK